MKMCNYLFVLACVAWAMCSTASANIVLSHEALDTDTYIDNRNSTTNYGTSGSYKMFVNAAGTGGSADGDPTRGLFMLPAGVWTALNAMPQDPSGNIDPSLINTATVTFYKRPDVNPFSSGWTIYLCPFKTTWNETSATWSNNGDNSYVDTAHYAAMTTGSNADYQTWYTWDISSLLANGVSRDELHSYGAVLSLTTLDGNNLPTIPETVTNLQRGVNMASSDWVNNPSTIDFRPFVALNVAPEPASLLLLAMALPVAIGLYGIRYCQRKY
jgi:hypothetical protein